MIYHEPARTTPRRILGPFIVSLLIVAATISVAHNHPSLASSSSTFAAIIDGPRNEQSRQQQRPGRAVGEAISVSDASRSEQRSAPGKADGVVPDGTMVFDEIPAVANLDPALLRALRRAAADAADDGVKLNVTSGWRSPKYQEQLLREAISKYGSEKEAARWVATPRTSAHVSGDAVDIGPSDATAWLSKHGATYGLCQIYRSEPWHYELRPEAFGHGCPSMYADPAHDPRIRQ